MQTSTILPMLFYFATSAFLGLIGLNAQQKYRLPLLALIIFFGVLSFRTLTPNGPFGIEPDFIGVFIVLYLSHIGCALCVEKHVLALEPGSTWSWEAAYRMLFNGRWIGTARQVPGITTRDLQSVLQSVHKEPQNGSAHRFWRWGPARTVFLRNRLVSLVVILSLAQAHHTLLKAHAGWARPIDSSDFLPAQETYLRRLPTVTWRETAIRTWLVFFFVGYAHGLYTAVHDALAIIFVGSGFDKPEDWPPLFGSVREAYSLRRFWGRFWHRAVYRSYTGYGRLLSERVLGIPRGSLGGRLVVNFFVFLMSGTVHALVYLQIGYSCGGWAEVGWYCLNFAGMTGEMAVQWGCFKLAGSPRGWEPLYKAIGFLWVFGFLFWSLPKSQFPKIQCPPEPYISRV